MKTNEELALEGTAIPTKSHDDYDSKHQINYTTKSNSAGHAIPGNLLKFKTSNGTKPDLCPLTDIGNAQRFKNKYRQQAIYARDIKRWLVCIDDYIWLLDADIEIQQMAKAVVLSIAEDASLQHEEITKSLERHSIKSQQNSRLKSMVELAQSEKGMYGKITDFDSHSNLIGMANGILDIYSGKLVDNPAYHLITKSTGVEYDPSEKCPEFVKFITQISTSSELALYLQQILGYALLGANPEKVLFILYGPKHNGKSTLDNIIVNVLGDYATNTKPETFMTGKYANIDGEKPSPELFSLIGMRYVGAGEIPEGKALDTSLVKAVTGNDTISLRNLYSSAVKVMMQFTLFMQGNHKPYIPDMGAAIADRIKLVPMNVVIPKENWNKNLAKELVESESAGIFNWLLDGLHMYLENSKEGGSFDEPEEVTKATEEYIRQEDLIASWMHDRIELNPEKQMRTIDAYSSYQGWCEDEGVYPCSQLKFGQRMEDKGYLSVKSTGGFKYYKGITNKTLSFEAAKPIKLNEKQE